jgi:hypothetical protein
MPMLLSSYNVGGDWFCLYSASFSPCANTFSNTVCIPAAIIANTIKDIITIEFNFEFILPLVYPII